MVDRAWVLVDCGRAATQRAVDAGLDLTSVVAVAITHHHSDHINDLATFATTRWTAGATTPLLVLAPEGPAAQYARRCLSPFDDQSFHAQASTTGGARPTIEVRAFDAGPQVSPVYNSAGWELASMLVDHHPVEPAVGYLVAYDLARVAVSGDTAVCDGIRALALNVDVLVHEALLADRVSPALLDWNAGARAVGELAAQVRPPTLVLTHLLPAPGSADDEHAYETEVRSGGFDGPTLIAHDGLRIPINPSQRRN